MDPLALAGIVGYAGVGSGIAYAFLKHHAKLHKVNTDDVLGCFSTNIFFWPAVLVVVCFVYLRDKIKGTPSLNILKKIADHFNKGEK
jgi:hypothetical protein